MNDRVVSEMASLLNHHNHSQASQPLTTAAAAITATAVANTTSSSTGRCGAHSQITYKNLKFLITDKPNDATLSHYIEELKRHRVKDVVRVCESTYSASKLQTNGITVHEMVFADGTPPPPNIIKQWLALVWRRFDDDVVHDPNERPTIAVHCVAGLGRAPVLVAIALVEAGMRYEEAVELIRSVRRGAINAKQLQYLSQYKRQTKKRKQNSIQSNKKLCSIV